MNLLFNRYIDPFDENILSIEIHCIDIQPPIYAAKVIYKGDITKTYINKNDIIKHLYNSIPDTNWYKLHFRDDISYDCITRRYYIS